MRQEKHSYTDQITEMGIVFTNGCVEGDVIDQETGTGDNSITYASVILEKIWCALNLSKPATMSIFCIQDGSLSDVMYQVTEDEEFAQTGDTFTESVERIGQFIKNLEERVAFLEDEKEILDTDYYNECDKNATLTEELAEANLLNEGFPVVQDVEQETELTYLLETFKRERGL